MFLPSPDVFRCKHLPSPELVNKGTKNVSILRNFRSTGFVSTSELRTLPLGILLIN